jgi:hypothetical protein
VRGAGLDVEPSLAAWNVTVTSARTAGSPASPVDASTPLGTSSASTGRPLAAIASMAPATASRGAPVKPVPSSASTTDVRTVQCVLGRAAELEAGRPRALLGPRRVAGVGSRRDDRHARLDAPLRQQPRDHQPVPAVVAAAAEHGDAAGVREALAQHELGGRGGARHQVDAGHAVGLDGRAVGGAHGRGVVQRRTGNGHGRRVTGASGPYHPRVAGLVCTIDQGTTGTRCLLLDEAGRVVAERYATHRQSHPSPGLVEHDAEEIWARTQEVVAAALGDAPEAEVVAVGIANQRETVVLWERATGRPVAPAIVWQDTRTEDVCRALEDAGTRRCCASGRGSWSPRTSRRPSSPGCSTTSTAPARAPRPASSRRARSTPGC